MAFLATFLCALLRNFYLESAATGKAASASEPALAAGSPAAKLRMSAL
jgi:hypothetical protein